ncbi:MAG: L-isoaspartyl protein carboxyl methyltransferase, partial [Patescibacteria group bacterium]|nr:L-isoaspartyl protein carboxyl methyltransferase [Patescibacteria group bacterium]
QAGEKLGFPDRAPYDKILVSAEAEELPKDLLEQLKIGGIIVIPIKNTLYKIEKLTGGKTKETIFPGFVFVPLMS